MPDSGPDQSDSDALERVLEPAEEDLGGFTVRRALPARARRMVGPFIFFDHMGPAGFPPGEGVQVRPHPHIGISTVTYLFEGEIMHRDSLGCTQPIRAGAVNLMTAGRGIVHSERAGEDLHEQASLHGIQSWMALPLELEECDPDFVHYPADSLPGFERDGVSIRVVIGSVFGHASPVTQHAATIYLECRFAAGSSLDLPADWDELGAYVVSGDLNIGGQAVAAGTMAVAAPGKGLSIEAKDDSHAMILGGEAFGKRHIWWNFVSSSKARIEQASDDWREGRFDSVPGDDEFIPLPD